MEIKFWKKKFEKKILKKKLGEKQKKNFGKKCWKKWKFFFFLKWKKI